MVYGDGTAKGYGRSGRNRTGYKGVGGRLQIRGRKVIWKYGEKISVVRGCAGVWGGLRRGGGRDREGTKLGRRSVPDNIIYVTDGTG